MFSLDELRKQYPGLGFALYAMTPGGTVTLEVLDGGEVYTFTGPTAQAAINAAFPASLPEPPTPDNVFD